MNTNTRTETLTARTPGPWAVNPQLANKTEIIEPVEGQCVAECPVMQDANWEPDTRAAERNAAFIVKACNSYDANQAEIARLKAAHDALVGRLADMVCRASAALDFAFADVPEGSAVPPVLTELEHSLHFARYALAKVQS